MFNTRNELLNLICMVSMNLVFLDPDGAIGVDDLANHNHLYSQFTYAQVTPPAATGSFAGHLGMYFDDEEE